MNLILVESPTKARTLEEFLKKKYKVTATMGHIRDLPKSRLGIDVEHNFEPHYIIPVKARKRVNELKKEIAKADRVILATDEDREGEAISYHITRALELDEKTAGKQTERIVFHEITKSAIEHALEHPRAIDMNMVYAQQSRRILDRLVGYKLSPFLWKKVMSRLSAGRVQSVALRLIAEREEEIKKFKPDEYWTITALLKKGKGQCEAALVKIDDTVIPKLGIQNKEEADKLVNDLKKASYRVAETQKKEVKRHPLPPFITSTLQQEASKRLGFTARQTMRFAQQLYETGLITYMRTDSVNLSQESLTAAKSWIEKNLGERYAAHTPRKFANKSRNAQEAHEAIRPTRPDCAPQNLGGQAAAVKKLAKLERNAARLYELIWRRFIASQLPPAIMDAGTITITASGANTYTLRATGNTLREEGYLKIWQTKFEEKLLPEFAQGDALKLEKLNPAQHFTEPPPRYNEASLIKTLEEYGIGRPSTYAPIISVIQDRHYVIKNEARRFQPTEVGEVVNRVLVEHFPEIVDIEFTAKMEEMLDNIAEGNVEWHEPLKTFYVPFEKHLEQKYEEVEKQEITQETTDEVCEKCGKPMIIKFGRFGKFLACSGFPECKSTKPFLHHITNEQGETMTCPECGKGTVIKRRTKRGRFFFGCSAYPDCKFASWTKPGTETYLAAPKKRSKSDKKKS